MISDKLIIKEHKNDCGIPVYTVYYGSTKLITFTDKKEAEAYQTQIKISLGGKTK